MPLGGLGHLPKALPLTNKKPNRAYCGIQKKPLRLANRHYPFEVDNVNHTRA